jgi:biotin operon repressor
MNRVDRMLATILLLQSRRVIKAEDIAEHFEISLRTVYRDMAALSEAGVPVAAEAGVGYSLLRGYLMPPVMFTAEEASALFLSGELIEHLTHRKIGGRFEFCVNLQTDAHAMPIEDPTVPWSQDESPYRKVATLRIFRQPVAQNDSKTADTVSARAAAAMGAVGERLSFSPWHGLQAHEPLGGINRARRDVYHTIAALRNSANRARMGDPSTIEFDEIRGLVQTDVTAVHTARPSA